eukprot:gnl/MRDRNA2_/MRDRNA2_75422_c0_seq1.p1 gnl/MRDRNA2_/MRDRNA2_75422_c0~~gnl/MRDRNA2_/MRDRNA2_75422_c0_seq1.p1  ORF type:complete len:856 (-),score=209.53 gnl/MRDRNA2_/MRDRNA2_75422_c0_seq1:17-2584(-)
MSGRCALRLAQTLQRHGGLSVPALAPPQRRCLQSVQGIIRSGLSSQSGHIFKSRNRSAALRWCSNNGPKEKPKATGFEKFYEKRESRSKAEANAPKETPEASGKDTKGPKENPQAEPKDSKGPAEGTEKGKADSSGGADKGKADASGGQKAESGFFGSGPMPNGSESNQRIALLVGGILLWMGLNNYFSGSSGPREITMQELMKEFLSKGFVEKIQIINQTDCRVQLRADTPGEMTVDSDGQKVVAIQLGSPESFEAKIEQLQLQLGIHPLDFVPIQYVNEVDYMERFLPTLLVLVPLLFAARAFSSGAAGMGGFGGMGGNSGPGGRNMFNIGKAFPRGKKDLKSSVKFSDVAGQKQAKVEVTEFVDFLKDPTKFEALGAKIPKGGLLVGPPGTGKTLLAKAVAGEANCPFYSMSGSDFIEMYAGVGPSRVRDLFQQARSTSPSIIFIDEIDAIGRRRGRGGMGGGSDERENTLNQMLVEMDGFGSGTGVVVLAGTNRKDILDPALTRPGRFDRTISIDKPDLCDRQEIFQVHLKPLKLGESLSKESVAQRMAALTPGFAGADIANICNEAAIFAARRTSEFVEMVDFEQATERVIGGLAKNNNLMGAEQKRCVALHESGHALAGWFLENADPLLKVSIVPRSNGALGFAQYLPEELALYSREAILDKMAVALGGRAAEELFVGQISTGASDDLDKVTKMAYAMVCTYGMNPEIGLVSFGQQNPTEQFYKPYSEETGQLIDMEAAKLIDQQYKRVKDLLLREETKLQAFADKLFEKETLVYKDIVQCLGDRPFPIQAEYAKFVTSSGGLFDAPKEEKAETTSEGSDHDSSGGGVPDEKAGAPAAAMLNASKTTSP